MSKRAREESLLFSLLLDAPRDVLRLVLSKLYLKRLKAVAAVGNQKLLSAARFAMMTGEFMWKIWDNAKVADLEAFIRYMRRETLTAFSIIVQRVRGMGSNSLFSVFWQRTWPGATAICTTRAYFYIQSTGIGVSAFCPVHFFGTI